MTTQEIEVITVTNTRPEHAALLAPIQKLAFPNLDPHEHLSEAQYLRHLKLFPEGQFVALSGHTPAGATSTLRVHFDFKHPSHNLIDFIDSGWLGTHQPDGEWLYGADLMVHPDFRRRGIARQLYAARMDYVRRNGLRGQIAGGMIPGYHHYAGQYTVGEYLRRVAAGHITDPTLTAQLKVGFRYVCPLHDYLHDPSSGNAAALIVWDNPDFVR